jgi:serine/threonine-protein phosphatase CPPED1
MRRIAILFAAIGCVAIAAVFSPARQDATAPAGNSSKFNVSVEAKNPWTSLAPNVAPDQFQFAIVSDRTGGHRKGVFSKAVQQVNLLQPEFVMSVGDLIEGSNDAAANVTQWNEFDKYAKQFSMPFFYCAGNHDNNNAVKGDVWKERLGRAYYHFTYQNCLFLVLNSNDSIPNGPRQAIGKDQQAYVEKALKENANVRWTFVFMHHPIWAARDLTENGWLECEKMLAGRKHNAFCGHVHVFRKFLRNNTSYYQLATTGGGSALRGVEYGEFDQIAWITMKKDGPIISQVGLDGIMKDDLSAIETAEEGAVNRITEGLSEVVGTATLKDMPARGLQVQFFEIGAAPAQPAPKDGRPTPPTGSGLVSSDGSFKVYQFRGSAGLKPGKYAVTFAPAAGVVVDNVKRDNPVPEKYRAANTTPFRVEVKADMRNRFEFKLEAE